MFYLCTTEYYKDISHSQRADVAVAFPLKKLFNLMGKVIADNNLHQLRIAETEKFAHVTYFFMCTQPFWDYFDFFAQWVYLPIVLPRMGIFEDFLAIWRGI